MKRSQLTVQIHLASFNCPPSLCPSSHLKPTKQRLASPLASLLRIREGRWRRGRATEWTRRRFPGSGRGRPSGGLRAWRSSPRRIWRRRWRGERASVVATTISSCGSGGWRRRRWMRRRGASIGEASATSGRRPSSWWPVASAIAASALGSIPSSIGANDVLLFCWIWSFYCLISHNSVEFWHLQDERSDAFWA